MADESLEVIEPMVLSELQQLVERAQHGDPSVLPRLRAIIDQHPQIWQYAGNVAGMAELAWIKVIASEHPLIAESIKLTAAAMKAELLGPAPTSLERLLIDDIIANWLELKYRQCVAATVHNGSLAQAAFHVKSLESAERRHQAAVRTLVEVRARGGLAPIRPSDASERPVEENVDSKAPRFAVIGE